MAKINITETVKLSNNHECVFKDIIKISDKTKGGERVIGITKTDGSTLFINESDIDEGKSLDDHLKHLLYMFINGEKWWEEETVEAEETTEPSGVTKAKIDDVCKNLSDEHKENKDNEAI